jgi:hypothetical protein
VLHFYREAEVALQHAIDHLRDIQRPRWALACSSRAHELTIQANRYVQAERQLDRRTAPQQPPTCNACGARLWSCECGLPPASTP